MSCIAGNHAASIILDLMNTQHQAMVQAHTDVLATLLADHYTLTHISGQVQPKDEWLAVIRSKKFVYHEISPDTASLSITVNGRSAVLRGRGIFTATINGTKRPWQLEFITTYVERNGQWKAVNARYTTY